MVFPWSLQGEGDGQDRFTVMESIQEHVKTSSLCREEALPRCRTHPISLDKGADLSVL